MFDAANRQICVVKTSRTNTPLHALTLLNNGIYVKAALALAKNTASLEDPITEIFHRVTKRKPIKAEHAILTAAYEREKQHYVQDIKAAQTLTATKDANAPHVAALTVVTQNILNLDETLTKE